MEEHISANPLGEIASWVKVTPDNWPEDAYEKAENAFIDTIACMIAGAPQPAIKTLYALISEWGLGKSTIAGHPRKLASPWAALVNGAAAHAIDFDDNFDPAKAHASAVLFPALMSVGEDQEVDIAALLDAYIVGLQVMGHVGQAVNPFHRDRGWHATSTMGAIGAAAGTARMLKLTNEQTKHAISMATSRAGGFMSQFGSDTKPLHAGFAASGGVQSALMARAGLSAGSATLDGPHGLRTLMVGQDVAARARDMIGTDEHGQSASFIAGRISAPLQILAYGLKTKRFPNCGSVHRALDGLLQLRDGHGLDADSVEQVMVRAPASHLRNLQYDDPQTPNEAKFSLEYNLATGLLQGQVGLADFTPEAIKRQEVRALLPKIIKEPVNKLESEFPTEVSVKSVTGKVFSTQIAMPVGSQAVPLTRDQLFEKFDDCCKQASEWTGAPILREKLQAIDRRAKLSELTHLLAITD